MAMAADPSAACFQIDRQILVINKAICDSIEKIDASERGFLSQSILSHLRNFVEHIMLKVYADKKLHIQDIDNKWDNIGKATDFVKTIGNLKFLWKFHNFLQISVSHYTLEEESSERLMLKYYEYLLKLKEFLKNKYLIDVLGNIDKFPLNTDSTLNEYYEKIVDKVNQYRSTDTKNVKNDSCYIQKIKPFFVKQKIYYEVTFTPVNEKASKFDRAIAFTNLDISSYYSARLFLVDETIDILGQTMPMFIIVN
ncbi:MAG: hypothetical protein ACTFAL_07570 [Candidatus Electronema sp. V4]|uniref:hypothetical protein n=1 Tax=Candidatus Electronema sp. V4 TaxID=3454756 RepID=UPI0040554739